MATDDQPTLDPRFVQEMFRLNAAQHDQSRHPFTCGNDSRHRPLIATRDGWRCADC